MAETAESEVMSSSASNSSVYHRTYFNAPREKSIHLDGEYIIYWTPHARDRAEYREDSGHLVLGAYLENVLMDISSNHNVLKDGYCCIRDFITGLFAVIHIDKQESKVRVVTCGDVNSIYPRKGEYVINRHKDHRIQTLNWD